MTEYAGAFQKDFVPVALEGQNLKLVPLDKYVKVKYVEQLPVQIVNFGAIAAGATSANNVITQTQMQDTEVGQFRIAPLDDVEITVRQLGATTRFVSRLNTYLLDGHTDIGSNMSEIFVYKDNAPTFDVRNPGTVNINLSRIIISGFRYVIEELSEVPDKYTAVPVLGYGEKKLV